MMDERDRERTGDAPRDLDGLGRDAAHAHGEAGGATQGGSVGRRTMGNAGDDLLGIDASVPRAGDDARRADHERGDGRSSRGADLPRGTDEEGGDASTGGRQAGSGDDDDTVDLDVTPEVGRRDPTR
jgi:hypothetical protein